jgi:dipicolinate synthase subunit B
LRTEYELVPVISETAGGTDTRFGTAASFRRRLETLCGTAAIDSVAAAEPLGTREALDALLVAPCTGNTLGKLAHGITDTAVTMACKAHLRNGRPLILAVATNDGLSGSAGSIAALLQRKHVYFVPFTQDDADTKPYSLQADFSRLEDTLRAALAHRQLQPLLG